MLIFVVVSYSYDYIEKDRGDNPVDLSSRLEQRGDNPVELSSRLEEDKNLLGNNEDVSENSNHNR